MLISRCSRGECLQVGGRLRLSAGRVHLRAARSVEQRAGQGQADAAAGPDDDGVKILRKGMKTQVGDSKKT